MRVPLLYREARYHRRGHTEASFAGAYVMGLAFAFGWTPCIGPVLATVLTLAASEGSLLSGVKLLFVYSLGLGIPFILAAVAVRPFLGFMKRFNRHLDKVEKVMGVVLIVTGLLFLFGSITGSAAGCSTLPRYGPDRADGDAQGPRDRDHEARQRPLSSNR